MASNKQVRIIAGITGGLTIALAGAAFTLSFNSLTELARQQGLSVPVLFPLILEGGLIVFSLTALTRSLEGQSTRFQWALVIGSSLTAMGFNIAHAPTSIMARLMWAIPSVVLLLAFENFLTQLRYRVNLTAAAIDLTELARQVSVRQQDLAGLDQNIQDKTAVLDDLIARIVRGELDRQIAADDAKITANKPQFIPGDLTALDKANATRQTKIEERRQEVLTLVQNGLTLEAIAGRVGASLSTVKADKKALNGKVNGGQL